MDSQVGDTVAWRWDPRNLIPALVFLAIGSFFLFNAVFVIGLGEDSAGSATFPTIVSVLLIGIGVVLLLRSARPGAGLSFLPLSRLLPVLISPIVFGLTVRPLGLVPSLVLCLACVSLAETKMPMGRRIVVILAITVLCVAIFHYGLRLPYPLVAGLNL